jgi:lysophospholipase L1-like esterase
MKGKIAFLVALVISIGAVRAEAKLVACVGDSITYGAGISDRTNNSYPAQLQRMLQQYDPAWEVRNFGVSGATLLRRGDKPYIQEGAYGSARACNPDIVVIKLGTNDSKPQNWQYKDDFVADYGNMIDVFRALPSRPQVWICKPVPAFRVNFAIRPEVIRDEILPLIDQIAAEKQVPVIDLYTALLDAGPLFPDAIHPNAEGAGLIAQTIAPVLLGVRFLPDFNSDGILNLLDFGRLAALWRESVSSLDVAPPPDGDGMIGYQDLAGLAVFWLTYPGLAAHWRLDETDGEIAADQLGDFDGTLHNGPLWRPAKGRIRGALELDGVDDYVSTGNVLNPADGPFTVFVWVKGGEPGQAILSQSGQSGAGALWLGTDTSGGVMTSLSDGGRLTTPLISQTVVTDGSWHRLRLVWDGSQRCLYVDGREAAVDTRNLGALRFSTGGFYIGAGRALEPGIFWSGLIDDIRFYSRAVKP